MDSTVNCKHLVLTTISDELVALLEISNQCQATGVQGVVRSFETYSKLQVFFKCCETFSQHGCRDAK